MTLNLVIFWDFVGVGKYFINPEEVSSIIELRRGCIIVMKNGDRYEVSETSSDAKLKLEGIV